jgi:Zn-finger nucleic acid-binding protein
MNCPHCKSELQPLLIEDLELDSCATCKGLWFHARELGDAKNLAEPAARWMDFDMWRDREAFAVGAGSSPCPGCGRSLSTVAYGETGVQVDACGECRGVWLEENELARIVAALRDEMADTSAAEYLREALEEGLEIIHGPERTIEEWRDFAQVVQLMKMRFFVEHPKLASLILGAQRVI